MPGALTAIDASTQSRFGAMPQIHSAKEAAAAFEGLLLKQLFGEMSKTIGDSGLFGSGFEGDLYGDMFVDALASEASKGGIGVAKMFEDSLGLSERPDSSSPIAAMAAQIRGLSAYRTQSPGPQVPTSNITLTSLVNSWVEGEASQRWGKNGALTPADLGADIATNGKDGAAVFNVLDANGYEGHPKCNLFALELLRRAGFSVPVQAREHGWGYPGAEAVTNAATSGASSPWGVSRTSASQQELAKITDSGKPLLLTGSGQGEVMGHMAVADQIHSVQRDDSGNIVSVEYSGWEAGGSRAAYGRRVWHLAGVSGPGRGGLSRIELVEPRAANQGETYHPIDSALPGKSLHDLASQGGSPAQDPSVSTDVYRRGIIEPEPRSRREAP